MMQPPQPPPPPPTRQDAMQLLALARDNKVAEIRSLVDLGMPVSMGNPMGQTALHIAALWGNVEAVSTLLELGADPNVTNIRGTTPLHFAACAKKNALQTCQTLLAGGALPDVREFTGRLPYMCANDEEVRMLLGGPDGRLFTYCEEGRAADLKELLDGGSIGSLMVIDGEGRTPLNLAVGSRDLDTIKLVVEQMPELVTFPDHEGNTPLHIAAQDEKGLPALQLLLSFPEAKEAVNATNLNDSEYAQGDWSLQGTTINPSDKTPLHLAAEAGNQEAVELLLGAGAEVDVRDFDGCSALHLALEAGEEEVVEALLEGGADVNLPNKDFTSALHFAATRAPLSTLKLVLQRGADVATTNPDGWTPLHLVARTSSCPKAEALLKAGAPVEAANSHGNTALHLAAVNGQAGMCELLLKHGAEKAALNKEGRTPVDLAKTDAVKKALMG